jgi:hypothetical protein
MPITSKLAGQHQRMATTFSRLSVHDIAAT